MARKSSASVNAITFSKFAPHLYATGSIDKTLKILECSENKPSLVDTVSSDLGTVFTAAFCVDSPFLVATAGGKGKLKIVDCFKRSKVANKYTPWLQEHLKSKK